MANDLVVEAVLKGNVDAGACNAIALTNRAITLGMPGQFKVLAEMRGASMAWVGRSTTNDLVSSYLDAFQGSLLSLKSAEILDSISKGLPGFVKKPDAYYDQTRKMRRLGKRFDLE